VWQVDCGSATDEVNNWLKANQKELKGVFLTHSHDDHTYGLRRLLTIMPSIPIYLSAHEGIKCVQDIRMNLSKYTSEPFQVFSDHFVELKDGEKIQLFQNVELTAIQADGHSPDSMIYKVGDLLFTGDAYIPPLAVVTKLPGADKKRAAESLEMIKELVEKEKLIIQAGHSINTSI
jgi:glyoxylase-like metal-dependent hydrolase (beta-lactamase superfamily II)